MMMETTRRSFLQGFMAATGLVAVGIPIPAAIAEPVVIDAKPSRGEIYVCSKDKWELLGVAISVSMEREPVYAFSDTEGYAHWEPSKIMTIRADMISDAGGMNLISDIFHEGKTQKFAIGSLNDSLVREAVMTEWTWKFEKGKARICEIELVIAPQIS